MTSPWNLVHPRFALWLDAGKPLRVVGILLSVCLLLSLTAAGVFGGLFALGHYGIGPFWELAARDREWSSVFLGGLVCAALAVLTGFSIRRQFRNLAVDLPGIEGHLAAVTEIDESYESGRGHCLCIKLHGKEYLLPYRLRKFLKAGMRVKVILWPASGTVRAVWVAW
jgi:hypothetical protein